MDDKNIMEMISSLKDNPNELRKRRDKIQQLIQQEMDAPMVEKNLNVNIVIDEGAARMFRIIEIFFNTLTDSKNSEDVIKYIMCSGLKYEMEKFGNVRDMVYNITNKIAETVDKNVLTEEEQGIIEEKSPPMSKKKVSSKDYWSAGYVAVKCHKCNKMAYWHPEIGDLICSEEGFIGRFEKMPRFSPPSNS